MQSNVHLILGPGFGYKAFPGIAPLLPKEKERVHTIHRPGNLSLPRWLVWFLGWIPIWYTNRYALREVKVLLEEYPQATFQYHAHSIGNITMWYVWYHLSDEEKKQVKLISHEPVPPQWLGMTFYGSFWKNGALTAVPRFIISLLCPFLGMRLGWETIGKAFLNSNKDYDIEGHIEAYQIPDSGIAFLGLLAWYSGMKHFRTVVQQCPSYRIVLAPADPLIPRQKIVEAIRKAEGDPNRIIVTLPEGTPHSLVRNGNISEDALEILKRIL